MSSDMDTANKRLVRNSLFMSMRMVFMLVISLYSTRVILDIIGVEDYGIYNVVGGFVSLFTFLNSSMASATQRFYNFEMGRNGENGAWIVFNASLRIHFILAIVIILIAEPIGFWFLQNKMVLPPGRMFAAECIFHCSLLSLFFTIVRTPFTAAVMAHERMDFYAYSSVLDALLRLLIIFILPSLIGDQLVWYGILFATISILLFFLYLYYCRKHFCEIHLGASVPNSIFKEITSFTSWGLFLSFAHVINTQGVNLVLNSFFGPIVNAARGVADQVKGGLSAFYANIETPARPQIIQSYSQGDLSRCWNVTFTITKIMFLLSLMLSIPLCFEIDFILHLWLGTTVPEHTSWFVIVMLITNTFSCLVSPNSIVMHATGQMKVYSLLSGVSYLLTTPLAYMLLVISPLPELAMIAYFITYIFAYLSGLFCVSKYADFSCHEYLSKVLSPLLLVAIISVPLLYMPTMFFEDGWGRFLFIFLVSFFLVASLSFVFVLNKNERFYVKNVFHNKFVKIFRDIH